MNDRIAIGIRKKWKNAMDGPVGASETQQQAEQKKEQGNALFKVGRYSEAAERYSEAMALCPENMTYVNNRAAAYLMGEQFARCIRDCETVLAAAPRDVK